MAALLGPHEPPAFDVARSAGSSPFVFACDHASRRLPERLGNLGLSEDELRMHIAWDIGIAAVGRLLAEQLDGYLILQNYSRLVIDVNRTPGTPQSILTMSESTHIPGNEAVTPSDAEQRAQEIFWPYHRELMRELDRRRDANLPTLFVALHSFTPVFLGRKRPWHAGVLYQRDNRVARQLLELLREEPGLVIGDNEPYAVSDMTDYSVVNHGEQRSIPHVEIELRQDLIAEPEGQREWAARLGPLLESARRTILT
jgi:predicted N-formylglutamate amidohydrolase